MKKPPSRSARVELLIDALTGRPPSDAEFAALLGPHSPVRLWARSRGVEHCLAALPPGQGEGEADAPAPDSAYNQAMCRRLAAAQRRKTAALNPPRR